MVLKKTTPSKTDTEFKNLFDLRECDSTEALAASV